MKINPKSIIQIDDENHTGPYILMYKSFYSNQPSKRYLKTIRMAMQDSDLYNELDLAFKNKINQLPWK